MLFEIRSLIHSIGSALQKTILRSIFGAKIGKNTKISLFSTFYVKKLVIGNDVEIKGGVKIKGNNIHISDGVIISENCKILGNKNLTIDRKSFLGKNVRINLGDDVFIGFDVGIGENSVIWTHSYFPPADDGYPITYEPVKISDKAWVTANVIILPGVEIGEASILGAGSVVTKNVNPYTLNAGNPSREIKPVEEIIKSVDKTKLINDIFRSSDLFETISNENNICEFLYKKKRITYISKNFSKIDYLSSKEIDILIFEGLNGFSDNINMKNIVWFDLSSKTRSPHHSKDILRLVMLFRLYGIRFLVEYE